MPKYPNKILGLRVQVLGFRVVSRSLNIWVPGPLGKSPMSLIPSGSLKAPKPCLLPLPRMSFRIDTRENMGVKTCILRVLAQLIGFRVQSSFRTIWEKTPHAHISQQAERTICGTAGCNLTPTSLAPKIQESNLIGS